MGNFPKIIINGLHGPVPNRKVKPLPPSQTSGFEVCAPWLSFRLASDLVGRSRSWSKILVLETKLEVLPSPPIKWPIFRPNDWQIWQEAVQRLCWCNIPHHFVWGTKFREQDPPPVENGEHKHLSTPWKPRNIFFHVKPRVKRVWLHCAKSIYGLSTLRFQGGWPFCGSQNLDVTTPFGEHDPPTSPQ